MCLLGLSYMQHLRRRLTKHPNANYIHFSNPYVFHPPCWLTRELQEQRDYETARVARAARLQDCQNCEREMLDCQRTRPALQLSSTAECHPQCSRFEQHSNRFRSNKLHSNKLHSLTNVLFDVLFMVSFYLMPFHSMSFYVVLLDSSKSKQEQTTR